MVRRGKLARNGLFHVEAFTEDQRLGLRQTGYLPASTMSLMCGVMSSSALSVLTRGRAKTSESSSSSFREFETGVN